MMRRRPDSTAHPVPGAAHAGTGHSVRRQGPEAASHWIEGDRHYRHLHGAAVLPELDPACRNQPSQNALCLTRRRTLGRAAHTQSP